MVVLNSDSNYPNWGRIRWTKDCKCYISVSYTILNVERKMKKEEISPSISHFFNMLKDEESSKEYLIYSCERPWKAQMLWYETLDGQLVENCCNESNLKIWYLISCFLV